MSARLEDAVALVTGASSGIGRELARQLAPTSRVLILVARRTERLEALAEELRGAHGGLIVDVRPCDLGDMQALDALAAGVESDHGRLDVLVNNAGIVRTGSLESMSLDDYMAVIQVNQVGVFLGMRAVVAAMRQAGRGSIINISSNAGMEGVQGVIGYVASKWAVRGMTKTAALELGADGIRVNSVHPGGVNTPMINSGDFPDVDQDAVFSAQPIPRVGQPEEIARLVLFLASEESSFSTGSEFIADGGRLAGHSDGGTGSD